jgi:hypothetical protein
VGLVLKCNWPSFVELVQTLEIRATLLERKRERLRERKREREREKKRREIERGNVGNQVSQSRVNLC